jgi:hypothetical protein
MSATTNLLFDVERQKNNVNTLLQDLITLQTGITPSGEDENVNYLNETIKELLWKDII